MRSTLQAPLAFDNAEHKRDRTKGGGIQSIDSAARILNALASGARRWA